MDSLLATQARARRPSRRFPLPITLLFMMVVLPTHAVAQDVPPPCPPVVAPPQAPAVMPVDLASISKLVAERNPTIAAMRQNVATASQVVAQAKAQTRGRADFGASYLHFEQPVTINGATIPLPGGLVTIPGQTIIPENTLLTDISATYPLYTGGRLQYNIERACFSMNEAEGKACDTELNVVLQASRAYLAALYGRENVRANEEALRSYQTHLDQTRLMHREGTATGYDVTRAEAAVKEQERALAEARNQYGQAIENLQAALSVDACHDCTALDVVGDFFEAEPACDVCQAADSALQSDPLLKSLGDQANAACAAERAIKAGLRPQVGALLFVYNISPSIGSVDYGQWFAGLQVSQQLFDGGLIRARALEQRSNQVQACLQQKGRGDEVRLGVRSAYLDMDTARQRDQPRGEKSVELARESLRLANRRFQEGAGTSVEVLDANVNLLQAETNLARARYQLDSAYLQAHRYIGDLLQVTQQAQALNRRLPARRCSVRCARCSTLGTCSFLLAVAGLVDRPLFPAA